MRESKHRDRESNSSTRAPGPGRPRGRVRAAALAPRIDRYRLAPATRSRTVRRDQAHALAPDRRAAARNRLLVLPESHCFEQLVGFTAQDVRGCRLERCRRRVASLSRRRTANRPSRTSSAALRSTARSTAGRAASGTGASAVPRMPTTAPSRAPQRRKPRWRVDQRGTRRQRPPMKKQLPRAQDGPRIAGRASSQVWEMVQKASTPFTRRGGRHLSLARRTHGADPVESTKEGCE